MKFTPNHNHHSLIFIIIVFSFTLALLSSTSTTTLSFTLLPSLSSTTNTRTQLTHHDNRCHSSLENNRGHRRTESTILHMKSLNPLFYRSSTSSYKNIPFHVFDELSSSNLSLPYTVTIPYNKNSDNNQQNQRIITIRTITKDDISDIVKMVANEYSTSNKESFPLMNQPNDVDSSKSFELIADYLDDYGLIQLVDITTRFKLMIPQITIPSSKSSVANMTIPEDHVILVLSIQDIIGNDEIDNDNSNSNNNEIIVGMIEISLQPTIPNRNPPSYPIPYSIKKFYYNTILKKPIQGWITNLLIVPSYRSLGYSKLLVSASEGIVQLWNHHNNNQDKYTSIHLHCDADSNKGGKIPQKLYINMGYHALSTTSSKDDNGKDKAENDLGLLWSMKNERDDVYMKSSIFFIQGVPLLYLYKKLSE